VQYVGNQCTVLKEGMIIPLNDHLSKNCSYLPGLIYKQFEIAFLTLFFHLREMGALMYKPNNMK
jgi:hypothetical protein